MRFSRVLLVLPSARSDTGSSRPSPSLAYVAQALEDADIEHEVLDMKLGYSMADLMSTISELSADLVGFTVFTLDHKTVFGIIEEVKRAFPDIKTIVGGPHIAVEKDSVLRKCEAIDYACVQEGEDLIVELANGVDLHDIKGLIFREHGKINSTGVRPYEDHLDRFGFPKLREFELGKYATELLIVSSRGCPYGCIYCAVGVVSGRKLRIRSVGSVVDEVEYWHTRGNRIFNFVDDNFTFHKDRVYQICDEIERRNLTGVTFRASNGVRADRLDRDLLRRMKEVGFKSIGIGVESGSNSVLKTLRKGETVEQIESAIKNACELGYEVALFFVFGTPGETLQDIEDSIALALKYPVFKVDFYSLIPFPGTALYRWVSENNAWVGDPEELLDSSAKNIRFGSRPFFETKELSYSLQIEVSERLLSVMRTVERNYLTNLLGRRLGPIGYPLALLVSTPFVQRLYFNNNRVRRIAERIRYSLM